MTAAKCKEECIGFSCRRYSHSGQRIWVLVPSGSKSVLEHKSSIRQRIGELFGGRTGEPGCRRGRDDLQTMGHVCRETAVCKERAKEQSVGRLIRPLPL